MRFFADERHRDLALAPEREVERQPAEHGDDDVDDLRRNAGQLKVVQEVIALAVFGGFMVLYLHEPLHWRHLGAVLCLMGAVAFIFWGKN